MEILIYCFKLLLILLRILEIIGLVGFIPIYVAAYNEGSPRLVNLYGSTYIFMSLVEVFLSFCFKSYFC